MHLSTSITGHDPTSRCALTEEAPRSREIADRVVVAGDRVPAETVVRRRVDDAMREFEQLLTFAQFEQRRDMHEGAFLQGDATREYCRGRETRRGG